MYDLTFIKLHTIETPKNNTKSRSSFVALTDCSYDLTVDSKQLTVGPSNV